MSVKPLHYCKICDRYYKSPQSYSNHKRKFHPESHQKTPNSHQKTPKQLSINEEVCDIIKCNFCNKIFSRKDSLNRHLKLNRCKSKNIFTEQKVQYEKELAKIKNMYESELISIKKELLKVMNEKCKKHPKTLHKINKQLNTTNNQTNNNCIVNNNTINIIPLGKEKLTETLSTSEQKMILNKKYQSLNYLIEYVHFNDKYPQFQNIIITNLKDNIAYKYDEKLNKFAATTKDDLLEIILENRIIDIEDFYNFNLDKLNENTKKVLNNFINKIKNSDEYFDKKKNDIKLILYNNNNNKNK